jgi:hypothetical protein
MTVLEQADCEIDAHADRTDLVLLMPEDCWSDFVAQDGVRTEGEAAVYRGVRFTKGPVTAVIPEEGF